MFETALSRNTFGSAGVAPSFVLRSCMTEYAQMLDSPILCAAYENFTQTGK